MVSCRIMSLSRKELEELRPMVDRTVHKFLGFSEGTLSTAALNCLDKGYDRRKTVGKNFICTERITCGHLVNTIFVMHK